MSMFGLVGVDLDQRARVTPLFREYRWNYLPDAVLGGFVEGRTLVDDIDHPRIGLLELTRIKLRVIGGDVDHPAARRTLKRLPGISALVCASEKWDALVREVHGNRVIVLTRFAFTSEGLDSQKLLALSSNLPDSYRMAEMDLKLANQLATEKSEFSSDHMVNYASPEDFIARGFGYCILDGEMIVSVATTFVTCNKGIEIQINTREIYKRKGLATAVAAQIMLHSLERGLDPNWDAANEASAHLAEKLGYTPQGTYKMYLLTGSRIVTALAKVGLKIKKMLNK